MTTRNWTGIWLKGFDDYCEFVTLPPAPYFRREFTAPQKIGKAVIHLCGLGLHELFVNGKKADDRWYTPALSQYDVHAPYTDYDVTSLLRAGQQNVIIVHIGSGFYNCHNKWKYTVNFYSWRATPRFLCDVEIDGNIVEASGMNWKTHPGPVTYDCHHEGEDYDARLEMPACFLPGYDDSTWERPFRAFSPGGTVVLDDTDPCRVLRTYPEPVRHDVGSSTAVFDFQTSLAGVVEFTVQGKAGTKVTIKYGEILDEQGRVSTANVDVGMERFDTDSYILKGGAPETWHPTFVWHGFRYAEFTWNQPDLKIQQVTGLFIGSDLAPAGQCRTSHPVLNRINQLVQTSYRCNFMGIPTDCPTREKFGWLGDANLVMETGFWNFHPQKGLNHLAQIVIDTQRPDGNMSTHGPTSLWGMEEVCPTFNGIYFVELCRLSKLFLDDDAPLKRYYPAMRNLCRFFDEESRDEHLIHVGFADWCHPATNALPDGTPPQEKQHDPRMIESAAYVRLLEQMAEFASYLGETEDAANYRVKAEKVRQAIHETFYNPQTCLYDDGFWTSNAMALYFDIVPRELRAGVLAALVEKVRQRKHQAWVGIQGAKYLPRVLAENGYVEDAFKILTQPDFPGWGYLVQQGATALWETWNGRNSRNHIMFGDVSAWSFRYLAGIQPIAPGFRKIRFQPNFIADVNDVQAEYPCRFGVVSAAWERHGNDVCCHFQVPDGCEAELVLPGTTPRTLPPGHHDIVVTQ